jgi:hypothetical protein
LRQLVPRAPPYRVSGARQADITSSSGRSRVRSGSRKKELCGQARLETASEPSQVRGSFRSVYRRSYPEGLVATAQTRTRLFFLAGPPRQKALSSKVDRARKGKIAAGSERDWQSPSTLLNLGRRDKPRHPTAKPNAVNGIVGSSTGERREAAAVRITAERL